MALSLEGLTKIKINSHSAGFDFFQTIKVNPILYLIYIIDFFFFDLYKLLK